MGAVTAMLCENSRCQFRSTLHSKVIVYQIELPLASSLEKNGQRCRAAAKPVERLEVSTEFYSLLSADRSTLSCMIEINPVILAHDG